MNGTVYAVFLDEEIRYVGQTSGCIYRRLQQHLRPKPSHKFYAAHMFRKAYLHTVRIRAIQSGFSCQDDLDAAEKYWIAYFRQIGVKLANTADGGAGGGTCRGVPKSQEHKHHISVARLGYQMPQAVKEKIARTLTGRPDWQSAEFRQLQAIRMRGNNLGSKNKGKKFTASHKEALSRARSLPIVDHNGVIYSSATQAAKDLGLHQAAIQRVVRGKQKQTEGYVFRLVGE